MRKALGVIIVLLIIVGAGGFFVYRNGVHPRLVLGILQMGLIFYLLSLFISHPALFEAFFMSAPSLHAGLVFFGMLYAPIDLFLGILVKWMSRTNEVAADRFAATTTGSGQTLATALIKLTAANLSNASGQFGSIEVGWHNVGSGNPGMPEALYGIKFDGAQGQTTALAFDSYRVPVWGDFYSKNGRAGGHGQNAAWNAGFTLGDYDPAGPPQDSSLEYHLLVPDTAGSNTPEVPEPATWILMGSALAGSWVLQRRRRRR